jgi:hypothetical protein
VVVSARGRSSPDRDDPGSCRTDERVAYQRGSRRCRPGPPPERGSNGLASFTGRLQPPTWRWFSSEMAHCAPAASLISTNANPRACPVARSRTMLIVLTWPAGREEDLQIGFGGLVGKVSVRVVGLSATWKAILIVSSCFSEPCGQSGPRPSPKHPRRSGCPVTISPAHLLPAARMRPRRPRRAVPSADRRWSPPPRRERTPTATGGA